MKNMDIIEIQRRLIAMEFPIQCSEHVIIHDGSERTALIHSLGALWTGLCDTLRPGLRLVQDLEMMQLMISGQATKSVTLLHKLREGNRLLIELEFNFTYLSSSAAYERGLEAFLGRWPESLSRSHPLIYATVLYESTKPHPWLDDYEGHDASPSLLVTSTTSARRLTMISEEEES